MVLLLGSMPRTPKPVGSEQMHFWLSAANDEFLAFRVKETLRDFSETMNSELDFLRLWGLSKLTVPRLVAAAASINATPMEYVQRLVMAAALQAPAAVKSASETKGGSVKRSINFTGPNLALVAHNSARSGLEFSNSLNQLLDFARAYGLPSNLNAALTVVAAGRGGSLRDLVLALISDTVARLPDPPAPRAKPARQ